MKIEDIGIYAENIDENYKKISSIKVRVGGAYLFSKTPTVEDVNLKLKEEAIKLGANAIVNVQYNRGMSWTSFETLTATGVAVFIELDNIENLKNYKLTGKSNYNIGGSFGTNYKYLVILLAIITLILNISRISEKNNYSYGASQDIFNSPVLHKVNHALKEREEQKKELYNLFSSAFADIGSIKSEMTLKISNTKYKPIPNNTWYEIVYDETLGTIKLDSQEISIDDKQSYDKNSEEILRLSLEKLADGSLVVKEWMKFKTNNKFIELNEVAEVEIEDGNWGDYEKGMLLRLRLTEKGKKSSEKFLKDVLSKQLAPEINGIFSQQLIDSIKNKPEWKDDYRKIAEIISFSTVVTTESSVEGIENQVYVFSKTQAESNIKNAKINLIFNIGIIPFEEFSKKFDDIGS